MIAILAMSLALAPQGEAAKDDDRYLTALKLEVSTIKDTLDPTDLLQFVVKFTNTSDAPLRLTQQPGMPGQAIVHLVDPEGRTWRPVRLEGMERIAARFVVLNPGEYLREFGTYSPCFMRLEEKREAFRLPQAGTWRLRAEYGLIKTKEATFHVRENARLSPKVRELFGSEAWHRFAMGGDATDEGVAPFRKFVLSGVDEGQRDVMATLLGYRDLRDSRSTQALEMFKAALVSRLGNLDPIEASLLKVAYLRRSTRFDEALTLLDGMKVDPKDIVRRRMDEMRAEIVKARGGK